MALVVAAVVLVAWLYSVFAPVAFESTASVLLRTSRNQQLFPAVGGSQQRDFERDPSAEFEFVESSAFSNEATSEAGSGALVSARFDSDATSSLNRSGLLQFVARSSDPVAARNAAQVWAETYLRVRSDGELAQTRVAIEAFAAQIEQLEAEKAEILAPLAPIDEALLTETDAASISLLTTQRVALQQSLDDELLPVRSQLRTVSDDLADLRIVEGFLRQPDMSARLSIEATNPVQVAPDLGRNLALGVVLGVLLGVGAALLLDSLRTALSNRGDVESVAGRGSVMAEVPLVGDADAAPELRSLYDAEVERVVSSVVHQASGSDDGYRLLVTSPGPSDGKSTMAYELGSRLALGGIDTVLVDADLRRPTLHTHLRMTKRRVGLAEVLSPAHREPVSLVASKAMPHLRFLPAGTPTGEAASLLLRGFSPALDRLARSHAGRPEPVIVVDSPPVLVVTDAEVIAQSVDGVVVVVRAGKTTRPELQLTLERLTATGCTLLGVVLVGATRETSGGYGYSYGYGPTHAEGASPSPRRRLRAVGNG